MWHSSRARERRWPSSHVVRRLLVREVEPNDRGLSRSLSHLFAGLNACSALCPLPTPAPLFHGVDEEQVRGIKQYESVRHSSLPSLLGFAQRCAANPCPVANPGVARARATVREGDLPFCTERSGGRMGIRGRRYAKRTTLARARGRAP